MFCEVEAILNDDPNDLEALTPNHILLLKGKPIFPPGLFQPRDLYIRKRWKQVQYIAELFWKRWISEYLLMLQERQKWTRPRRNLTPGDVVITADAVAPRGSWMMGRVLSTTSDPRGLVCSVCLQTKTSVLERSTYSWKLQTRIMDFFFLSFFPIFFLFSFSFRYFIEKKKEDLHCLCNVTLESSFSDINVTVSLHSAQLGAGV
ncbi:hypothetical protein LDENG_00102260 [Lucifuga dentata]|nr:hypothetical protein LDENG_00102260 [Lucifuga dentata]